MQTASHPFLAFSPRLTSLSLALPLLLTACGAGDLEGDLVPVGSERELTVESSGQLEVDHAHGRTFIIGEEGRSTVLVRPRLAEGADVDPALLDEVVVRASGGAGADIVVEVPTELEGQIDMELVAPEEMLLAIDAGEDPVDIDGMHGTGAINATSGGISITGFKGGSLAINSTSGDVLFDAAEVGGADVAINTTSGEITLSLPTDASCDLVAQTTEGSVEITGLEFDGLTFGGSATGTLGSGAGALVANSTRGDIHVRAR